MAVSKSSWNPFNQKEAKYAMTEFFCQGRFADETAKALGVSEEYEHIKHARSLQEKAQAEQQKKIWDSIFKR